MFNYYKQVNKTSSTWGSIRIRNVAFTPSDLQAVIPNIVFQDDNLAYMFQMDMTNKVNHINTCDRFIPPYKSGQTLDRYIRLHGYTNNNFYSFLAEGLLSIVYRDICGYQLANAVIDINSTLNDSHTGADACMYDKNHNVIVLGEAKFYQNYNLGIKAIINDFTKNKIVNKIESLYQISSNTPITRTILMNNLGTGEYERIFIDDFLKQKIIFAGFVLHDEKDGNISDYNNASRYDKYSIDVEMLEKNIKRSFHMKKALHSDYEIIIVHLPINSKYQLIKDVIEMAELERERVIRA